MSFVSQTVAGLVKGTSTTVAASCHCESYCCQRHQCHLGLNQKIQNNQLNFTHHKRSNSIISLGSTIGLNLNSNKGNNNNNVATTTSTTNTQDWHTINNEWVFVNKLHVPLHVYEFKKKKFKSTP